MVVKDVFELVGSFEKEFESNFLEISIKQSQISFRFANDITPNDIDKINSFCKVFQVTHISCFQDEIYVNIENLSVELLENENNLSKKFGLPNLYLLIEDLKKCLCSCPALQFVVSPTYIKVFLDVPNITIDGLLGLNSIFSSNGVLELNIQRPYALYVKDW